MIPRGKEGEIAGYYLKVGMEQGIFEDAEGNVSKLTPYTILRRIPLEVTEKPKLFRVKFSDLKVRRARKTDLVRSVDTTETDVAKIYEAVENSPYVDVVGLTKGKGTTGIVQRRKVKKGKRKGSRANCTRIYGSRGLRGVAKMVPTQPFAGKHGNSLRTILNCKTLGLHELSGIQKNRHYSREGHFLLIKGSVPGKPNHVLKVRPAIRRNYEEKIVNRTDEALENRNCSEFIRP